VNNADIIARVAETTGSTKADAKKNLDAVIAAITSSLAAGNEISLTGFGKFKVKARDARMGRNPATGEAVQIPAGKNVKFAASKMLKDLL